jgi:NADPH:quinone reductase-like Zn-dependent oxidoreductase
MAANTTQTSRALVVDNQTGLTLREIARPAPQPNQVLVKVSHVAQNPTDGKWRTALTNVLLR